MDEVNVQPVDIGLELRQAVQLRLAAMHVVIRGPVSGEFLNRLELNALGVIRDGLLVWPPSIGDAVPEGLELLLGCLDGEWPDG